MDVTLPFSDDELPEIVGGMFLTSVMTSVQLMQLRVAITEGRPDALEAFQTMASEHGRRTILIEAIKQVSVMMPENTRRRLVAEADAIASQILGHETLFQVQPHSDE